MGNCGGSQQQVKPTEPVAAEHAPSSSAPPVQQAPKTPTTQQQQQQHSSPVACDPSPLRSETDEQQQHDDKSDDSPGISMADAALQAAREQEEAEEAAAAREQEQAQEAARLEKEEAMRKVVYDYQRRVAECVSFKPNGPTILRDKAIWRASMASPSRARICQLFGKKNPEPDRAFLFSEKDVFKMRIASGVRALRSGWREAYLIIVTHGNNSNNTVAEEQQQQQQKLSGVEKAPFVFWFDRSAAPKSGSMSAAVPADGAVYLVGARVEVSRDMVDGKFRVRIDPAVPRKQRGVGDNKKDDNHSNDDGDDNGVEFGFTSRGTMNNFLSIVDAHRLPPKLDEQHMAFMAELKSRQQQQVPIDAVVVDIADAAVAEEDVAADAAPAAADNTAAAAASAEKEEEKNEDDFDLFDGEEDAAAIAEAMLGSEPAQADWMKDDDVKACCKCKKEFSLFRRKHHCRHPQCLRIFCADCCPAPKNSQQDRRCLDCLEKMKLGGSFASKAILSSSK